VGKRGLGHEIDIEKNKNHEKTNKKHEKTTKNMVHHTKQKIF
jgi:hypothetical protein